MFSVLSNGNGVSLGKNRLISGSHHADLTPLVFSSNFQNSHAIPLSSPDSSRKPIFLPLPSWVKTRLHYELDNAGLPGTLRGALMCGSICFPATEDFRNSVTGNLWPYSNFQSGVPSVARKFNMPGSWIKSCRCADGGTKSSWFFGCVPAWLWIYISPGREASGRDRFQFTRNFSTV